MQASPAAATAAAGVLLAITIFVFFGGDKKKRVTVPSSLEPRIYPFPEFLEEVVKSVLPLGFSRADIQGGEVFVQPKPDSGKPSCPDGDGLFEGNVDLAAAAGKGMCVLLNLGDSVPAAAGAAGGGAAAPASPVAGITAGLGKLKLVSFEPAKVFTAIRYDTMDEFLLRRPLDFSTLMSLLQTHKLFSSGECLCYFPFDNTDWTNDTRIRLNASTFDGWNKFDQTAGALPKVWIYPPPTPTKPSPAVGRAEADKDSAMTPSEQRLAREEAFKVDVRALDKSCRFPGCKEVYVPGTTAVEAAHIIPRYILNIKRYNSNQLYKDILDAAEFSRLDIDTPRNGMLLCANHHKSFDDFWWTFFPPKEDKPGTVEVSKDARKTFSTMLTTVDFSHRKGGQRPPATVWGAYNALVFPDAGKALKAAAKCKEPVAVGGGGGAAGGSS